MFRKILFFLSPPAPLHEVLIRMLYVLCARSMTLCKCLSFRLPGREGREGREREKREGRERKAESAEICGLDFYVHFLLLGIEARVCIHFCHKND